MTKYELNKFRKTLESRQAQLGIGGSQRETLAIETSPDELDRIQHATEFDYAMANQERNTLGLSEAREALRRIDSGAFGICASCGEQIKPKRLAAVPWATLCIVCQKAADCGQPWDEFGSLLAA